MINKLSPDEKKLASPFLSLPGEKISYILDENLRFRPEPGCDPEPVPEQLPLVMDDPEPWAPEQVPDQLPSVMEYTNDINDLGWNEGGVVPYLEDLTLTGIPVYLQSPEFDLKEEISTSGKCSKVYNSLFGRLSGDLYQVVLHCMKFWCDICGGWGKKIHKRRQKLMYKKTNRGRVVKNPAELLSILSKWNIQEIVYPLPKKDRYKFASWEGLNQIFGSGKRTTREHFPNSRVVAYMHTVGKYSPYEFHPHVHVVILTPKKEGVRLQRTKAELAALRDSWARSLRRLGCSDVRGPGENIAGKLVNLKYLYARNAARVLQKIKYECRPLGPKHLKAWQESPGGQEMVDLHVRELKGFQFIRNWDRWANCNYSDTEDAVKEFESVFGEPLEHIGYTPAFVVREMFKAGKLEKISEDVYVQRRHRTRNRSP